MHRHRRQRPCKAFAQSGTERARRERNWSGFVTVAEFGPLPGSLIVHRMDVVQGGARAMPAAMGSWELAFPFDQARGSTLISTFASQLTRSGSDGVKER